MKDKTISSKKWLIIVGILILCFLLICSIVTYIIDPMLQYRTTDNKYYLSEGAYPGLIKNYDYDTILIGSSMSQNFDMDQVRTEWNCQPLKVAVGGMNTEELIEYIQYSQTQGKADKYYVGIDLPKFARIEESKNKGYLLNDGLINKLHYSIAFETILRFEPVDIGLMMINKLGYRLSDEVKYKTQIDNFTSWGHRYESCYDYDYVVRGYQNGMYVLDVVNEGLSERLKSEIDRFFSEAKIKDIDCTFYFPPYSSLFWCITQDKEYFEEYLAAKEYFVKKANEAGASVYDFQGAEFTMDLNNYKDVSHYSPAINAWMIELLNGTEYKVNAATVRDVNEQIRQNTLKFRLENSEIF